ncbi:MAG: STAS domain-containing protein [bacterium]
MAKIDISTRDGPSGTVILKVGGSLDAHTVPKFESALRELIEKGKCKIIVDFARLDYISSAGLGVFMSVIDDTRGKGGDIKLVNLTDKIYKIFELLGFDQLFQIFKSESEAVAAF